MPEQEPFTTPDDVEEFIRRHARRFSGGDSMLAEDLEQEASIACYEHLQEAPDAPDSHLVVKARDAIYKYRRNGSSVDGKLNLDGRDRHYPTFSLQEPISDEDDLKEGIIGDSRQGRRPTETHAVTGALVDHFRESLSDEEDEAFTLRLTETSWEEIGQVLDQGEHEMYRIRTGLEEKALAIWERPEEYRYVPKRGKREDARGPKLPKETPEALLDVLTEQELTALAAYREGATQREAAKAAGMSQATVSRIISFVWENHDKQAEGIAPRTTRHKNDNRREQVMELFYSRPAGELVSYEELLEVFSDVKDPWGTMWKTVSRYSGQMEGARIELVKGEGYRLVVEV